MAKALLTNADFERAAQRLDCEVSAIKALDKVESRGKGFLADGRCLILFERHIFSRLTKRIYDKDHPDISNREPGGYLGGTNEYDRYNRALALDSDMAMCACSWGRFQVMGFNFEVCGFDSVAEFVTAMESGEPAQLDIFCSFIEKTRGLKRALQRKDWISVARLYNGPNYAINKYDKKLAKADKEFSIA